MITITSMAGNLLLIIDEEVCEISHQHRHSSEQAG
jgi:hypothetical protein